VAALRSQVGARRTHASPTVKPRLSASKLAQRTPSRRRVQPASTASAMLQRVTLVHAPSTAASSNESSVMANASVSSSCAEVGQRREVRQRRGEK
jgi:hypothetical protein